MKHRKTKTNNIRKWTKTVKKPEDRRVIDERNQK